MCYLGDSWICEDFIEKVKVTPQLQSINHKVLAPCRYLDQTGNSLKCSVGMVLSNRSIS